jgi:Polyketide cyclase / dehydrase and lipid transport
VTAEERYVVTRTIPATPAEVFAVLSDPVRHQETEPGDWVRDAVDTEPITSSGQMFAVNMYLDRAGGHYVMHNLVTEYDQDRTIAWLPGQLAESGRHDPGGWWWRYDLIPNGAGTDVTLTYDWSDTVKDFRDTIGVPVFEQAFIEASLESLERAVLTTASSPR